MASVMSQGKHVTRIHRNGLWQGEDAVQESPPSCPIYLTRKKGPSQQGPQRSLRSSATSSREAVGSETRGQPKPHNQLVTSLGLELGPRALRNGLVEVERTFPRRGSQRVLKPWGYLCWDRNRALQRQSWEWSSKQAQERKESSEKNRGLAKRGGVQTSVRAQPIFTRGNPHST